MAQLARQPIVFGGGDASESELTWSCPLTCPRDQQPFPCSTIRLTNAVAGDRPRGRLTVEVGRPFGRAGVLLDDLETGYLLDGYRLALWSKAEQEIRRRGDARA